MRKEIKDGLIGAFIVVAVYFFIKFTIEFKIWEYWF